MENSWGAGEGRGGGQLVVSYFVMTVATVTQEDRCSDERRVRRRSCLHIKGGERTDALEG